MQRLSPGTRIGSAALDHVFMTMIAMLFIIPAIINKIGDEYSQVGNISYFFLGVFAVYVCKDCINGRSLAKRIIKLQVVDNKTGIAASPFKCLIRNLFLLIWPVELIVLMINPERRIGDRVAGTKVVAFDFDAEQPKTNFAAVLICLTLAYAFIFLLNRYAIPHIGNDSRHYVESSYNEKESSSLKKLFADSMGTKLTAEVKIYDSIEHHNVKFIRVIYFLKQDYFADVSLKKSLKTQTTKLILSLFPEGSYTGVATYIYKDDRRDRRGTEDIGKHL